MLFISTVLAQNQQLEFETFFSVHRVGAPVVAADGKWIAFTVQQADISTNSYQTQIWIMREDGSELKKLTTEGTSNGNPHFSSDGKFLFYKSNRSGSSQILQHDLQKGVAKQVSDIYDGAGPFKLDPSQKAYITARSVPTDCPDEECIKKIKEARKGNPVKARIVDKLMYRHWNQWLNGEYSHLFLGNFGEGNPIDITPGPYHAPPISLAGGSEFHFSPDGQEICYVSNRDEQVAWSTNNDIFLYTIDTKKTFRLSKGAGNDHNPHYSPDRRFIAYASMEKAGFEADRNRLMLFDRKSKQTTDLTGDFTLSVEEIIWSPDSKHIYFSASDAANKSVFRLSIKDKKIKPVLKGHYVSNLVFLNAHTLAFNKQSMRRSNEIYTLNLKSNSLQQLTRFNDEIMEEYELPAYEEFWFVGALGEKVQGFIMKPPGFQKGQKYPAIHLIHGGPQGMWGNNFHYRWNYQMFAAPGYVVYWINFHGSRGYGQKFTDVISGHWGDYPYEDVVKATEYVLENYDYVDGEKLGAAGASYGGFMINWIAGHENPYKCLVSHDGVYEQVSMWGATEELWFPEWEFGGVPWQNGTTFDKWSPARLAGNFKTPMLIIHGEQDYRVPYTQGLQLFSALQRQGVPSRLLFFPDEDHFVRKPQNAKLWWKTVHNWFAEYLK
jgi:dipeptidyl aminopeptidase/acylaminoacyl peptidase